MSKLTEDKAYAIELKNISKSYDNKKKAVDNISFVVPRGTTYALLGPNGAGKSTTISILTSIIDTTSGEAFINGFSVKKNPGQVRRSIGVTFQDLIIDEELTGYQVLDYHGRLYGLKKAERKEKIQYLLELVGLEKDMKRKCKEYSGGMKRRLELVRSLVNEPSILFLDEPTLGLDPIGRAEIWDYIKTMREKNNMTVLLTTHYLDEAYRLADKVGILNNGKIVVEGVPNEMIDELGEDVLLIKGSGYNKAVKDNLTSLPYTQSFNHTEGTIQLGIKSSSKHLAEVIAIVTKSNFDIEDISISKPDLGAVFLKYTGQEI